MNDFLAKASIFVSVASYRDEQLPQTVQSLFSQADHPERIFIGIFNQIDLVREQHCLAKSQARVVQHIVDYQKTHGACWARGYVWKKMLGEQDFALQIDSHSRFAKGWDTTLLNMYQQLNDRKAVITHYPMGFNTETNQLDAPMYTYFNVQQFRASLLPDITAGAVDLRHAPQLCAPTAFLAAGCLFGRAQMFKDVPYDPFIYFHGEEITYAARLWTHGYNLYLPNTPFMWHDYQNLNQRPLHWKDHGQWKLKDELAQQRCRHLLRIQQVQDKRALHHLEHYGLGFERSLDQYQAFSGVNFRQQQLDERAKSGNRYLRTSIL